MENYNTTGSTLAGRYANAVRAANKERREDAEPNAEFDSYVQSDFDRETNGPTPPEEPETNEERMDAQFGSADEGTVDRTKEYLINKAKSQVAGVADM